MPTRGISPSRAIVTGGFLFAGVRGPILRGGGGGLLVRRHAGTNPPWGVRVAAGPGADAQHRGYAFHAPQRSEACAWASTCSSRPERLRTARCPDRNTPVMARYVTTIRSKLSPEAAF